ncbi:O-antigen ligase family protein [Antarcticibacterium sp. 1MA-6-2]|uniref:O-antigen ligase family protein n=1 Tax=Antarcticibacterium sp. 1MA-6-2 TaxID=2908210 RepID=UPI001F2590E1|nr:O-antigen ligase family protein [Antarcticibacterium sp. 1MA-6-2]UJH89867.1 O-antigen ligase family protein [Antarcticibacterium sp. 1MA-6-2]
MDYGYQMMLPVFFGSHLGRILFKWKFLIFIQLAVFGLILIFGNRMASIACIVFVIFMDFFYLGFNKKKFLIYFLIGIIASLGILFLQDILAWIAEILERHNLSSYSLRTIINFQDLGSFSAGRDIIWDNATGMILEKPIFGHGIGVFEVLYDTYSHNVILDLLISFGFVGFLIYFYLLIKAFKKILNTEGYVRLLGIILFCTSFPKLFTSIYIFKELSFLAFLILWIFCALLNQISSK